MASLRSLFDQSVKDAVNDARRRAAMSDKELEMANLKRPFPSPVDWRDTCMYFLVVDRFNNPDAPPKSERFDPAIGWDMHFASRQGGTLNGITAQLPYLQQLGINAVWISPLVRNVASADIMTYHGYAAQDLLAIDERWASNGTREKTEAELIAMVGRAHDLGIYVILDIVLNHFGMVFWYDRFGTWVKSFEDRDLLNQSQGGGDLPSILWTEGYGGARGDWRDRLDSGAATGTDEAVYPLEFRDPSLYRRRGSKVSDNLSDYSWLNFIPGDFGEMRQLAIEYIAGEDDPLRAYSLTPALSLMLQAYQYLVARYDFDGFRIDTVKYIHPKFIQRFGNAMTEFGYSIGKKNFFTFGEVADNNANIASFVGRNGSAGHDPEGGLGIDAALDFPLADAIRDVCTGPMENRAPVNRLRDLYDERRKQEDELVSSHGDASKFFVTFADNHDRHQRVRHPDSLDAEVRLCLALLYVLPGIPCLYYGTEQDLKGTHNADGTPRLDSFESVREALWGKFVHQNGAWPMDGGTFLMLQALSKVRKTHMPLRYGRYYFREVSGDGRNFGWSMDQGGVFTISRVHCDQEVLIAAYPNVHRDWHGWVEVDADLSVDGSNWKVVFSTLVNDGAPTTITWNRRPLRRAIPIALKSNELQILVKK
ncbi:alpha-amylase [Desulfosarcina variabilis str. Montpellier]|uniref:alpha-amylase family glycosyl hydrolase n=1 Tax=Desulfosarcina variabilis TaxID=2300 RepID=UPI003AFAFB21